MSTFTAVGPRLDLVGPRPTAPPHSLLETEGVVVDSDSSRWLNGVNLIGYPDDTPSLWEPCSTGTFRTKSEGTARPEGTFDALVAYIPVTCSTYGWEDLADQAEAVLEATLSWGVERALARGFTGSGNPSFGDTNLSILAGGAAQTAAVGLSYLEDAIGATGRMGMIHATPAIGAAWQMFPADRQQENPLRSINGTPIVLGGGYIGTDPASGATPAAGQGWAFATGPVEVRLGPTVITDIRESLDRSDNSVTFRAERYFLATWDRALQAGVLIDWTP